ncbi:MAG: helix-turn-helix domain-containing protein [Phycisphaeraceae bacterium]|nr:helix-turn-helix domain-containing protein [Phycisphaeraceae bacterium]
MSRHTPPEPPGIKPLLTYRQAADVLGVTERSIRNYVKDGVLPAVRFCGNVRIDQSDLQAFIERNKRGGSPGTEDAA